MMHNKDLSFQINGYQMMQQRETLPTEHCLKQSFSSTFCHLIVKFTINTY